MRDSGKAKHLTVLMAAGGVPARPSGKYISSVKFRALGN